jgi:hypothetical protein
MQTVIDNFLNGNLTDAKKGAKRHTWLALFKFMRDECGMSSAKAEAVADYLKGKGSFQAACDAV